MVGAGVTTQVLKPLLATQRDYPTWHWMGPEAYPSGHTTAAMSLALALVIVSSPRWRPLAAAAGGLLTVGMVFSLLVLGSHYPSDVAGGILVATGWACLSTAALRLELRPTVRRTRAGRRDRSPGRVRSRSLLAARGGLRLRRRQHDVRGGRAAALRRRARAQR